MKNKKSNIPEVALFEIAVIGAGPGGLSAAARCAELGVSHILLESSPKIANTIQMYQKGKHVMAEPGILPLRSPIGFDAGKREEILDVWEKGVDSLGINIKYSAEVKGITGAKGGFSVTTMAGETIEAKHIILGIGMQGNPRQLGVPGDQAALVQYQLDDPDEYRDESIIVVGAGDAAIENAIALSGNNKVYIINRRDEFARAKEGNLNLITSAIDDGSVECFFSSSPAEVHLHEGEEFPASLVLKTSTGEASVPCHRIIARLGAVPPRGLVESFGIEFPSDDPTAIPALTSQYESNVSGMYVIGALGGYPLIKQAMNQGYEVVEYILGHDVKPADHDLLAAKFNGLPFDLDVDGVLNLMQERIPVFGGVNALQFRELMLDSQVHVLKKGDLIFKQHDYTNTFFTILQGTVDIQINPELTIASGEGSFFGEMSLMSGRRRSATVFAGDNCIVIETPRRTMIKLISSVEAVKRVLDETFIVRTIQQKFAPNTPIAELQPIAARAQIHQYAPKEIIFKEGDVADTLHFIRSGSVTVSINIDGRDVVMSYVPANTPIGEMGLLGGTARTATVAAAVKTETISIDKESFDMLLDRSPGLKERLQAMVRERTQQNVSVQSNSESGDLLSFLMGQGLGEATDVLLIDEDSCVGCDFCESACAATHDGTSRLNRKAGPTFAHIHVPTSCRHCEDPSCMKDCPPDAIQRGGLGGEVFIGDNCIGCGNCERNCPYGVIQLAYKTKAPGSFWSWMLFGRGQKPGKGAPAQVTADSFKQAVKCDMCKDQKGGPACVRACPTGAAMRLSPEDFVELVNVGR
ncbi:MAG: cyclic nucleotide-binding domain-containing protein [Pseudomonadales bacterium]|nr:cyclic nucleotide-binding domain-containing protein [Pseudomonadales bacterium]